MPCMGWCRCCCGVDEAMVVRLQAGGEAQAGAACRPAGEVAEEEERKRWAGPTKGGAPRPPAGCRGGDRCESMRNCGVVVNERRECLSLGKLLLRLLSVFCCCCRPLIAGILGYEGTSVYY